MKTLDTRVRISRRFQRSIRIDSDLNQVSAIEGYICPESSKKVLSSMAHHVTVNKHGAFTWTGPYGSGKSSLVVAMSTLLSNDEKLTESATEIFGEELVQTFNKAFPKGDEGWQILPVVGRRDSVLNILGEALQEYGFVSKQPRGGWNERSLIKRLLGIAQSNSSKHGGLVVYIDELGKVLEASVQNGSDVFVLQEIAEAANRSNGQLIVVGVLHQAFEDYARRLSYEARDEWTKIQGRFIDQIVDIAGEEQIHLISKAIEADSIPHGFSAIAETIANITRRERPDEAVIYSNLYTECWPLHPIVVSLLGPISRRRFGQNQRSIFGFLNSVEPYGLQDFLKRASGEHVYSPDLLWDYLRTNLEPSILASTDGHRWATAVEAIERCELIGGEDIHIKLLKSIAVIDLFRERSGIVANKETLSSCFLNVESHHIEKALSDLHKWSFTLYKKFIGSYAIFAGSDFDIEQAIREALNELAEVNFHRLKSLANVHPIVAKRHYHETGALRWFDVNIVPVKDIQEYVSKISEDRGAVGQFLIAIPTQEEKKDLSLELCQQAANTSEDVVVGLSERSWNIIPLAQELFAVEKISHDEKLAGDSVARREVDARLVELQSILEYELEQAFDSCEWFRKGEKPQKLRLAELNHLASSIATEQFCLSPKLKNELLNRVKPSGSAIAAQNNLLRRMVLNNGLPRLGIEGFPAEGGLFASLLEYTGLYKENRNSWAFVSPEKKDDANLFPLWKVTLEYIKENADRPISISEIFDKWASTPYGLKKGVMPVLAVAFILSEKENLAIYREGIFRANFDDVDVEYLAKDASAIQIRWMDLSELSKELLSGLADIVKELDPHATLEHFEPLDVARGLVAVYDQIPNWSKRTNRLSQNAVHVRELFKRAKDPNKFLFDDIPAVLGKDPTNATNSDIVAAVTAVKEGLEELVSAYPSMLQRLRDQMLSELLVPNDSSQAISELQARAENVRDIAGDFRLDAFVGRLTLFNTDRASFEGIASLAANKPPRDWVDMDLDRAAVELAELSQKFIRAEMFTRVKGRSEKRQAMAIMLGNNVGTTPIIEEFSVADADKETVDALVEQFSSAINQETNKKLDKNVVLAALAQLSTKYIDTDSTHTKNREEAS